MSSQRIYLTYFLIRLNARKFSQALDNISSTKASFINMAYMCNSFAWKHRGRGVKPRYSQIHGGLADHIKS